MSIESLIIVALFVAYLAVHDRLLHIRELTMFREISDALAVMKNYAEDIRKATFQTDNGGGAEPNAQAAMPDSGEPREFVGIRFRPDLMGVLPDEDNHAG